MPSPGCRTRTRVTCGALLKPRANTSPPRSAPRRYTPAAPPEPGGALEGGGERRQRLQLGLGGHDEGLPGLPDHAVGAAELPERNPGQGRPGRDGARHHDAAGILVARADEDADPVDVER